MRYMSARSTETSTLWTRRRGRRATGVDAARARARCPRGQYLAAAPLHPTSTATSVRIREGKRLVTDGPFAETREQLGGYFLIEARDLDEAMDIAARIPWRAGAPSKSGR